MEPIVKSRKRAHHKALLGWLVVAALLLISAFFIVYIRVNSGVLLPNPALSAEISPPAFSHRSGFYTGSFYLVMSAAPGSRVFYTTDGSDPGLTSFEYRSPVKIHDRTPAISELTRIRTSPRYTAPPDEVFKGMVIRAVAVKESKVSAETKHSFFVHPKGRKKYTLPVVSLVTDPENLFSYQKGIYVMGKAYDDKDNYAKERVKLNAPWWEYPANYRKRGQNWERPVFVEFFEENKNSGFAEEAGVRIHGTATRGFSQKSLRLIFSKDYGSELLHYPLFTGSIPAHKKVILRTSGNDWNRTRFRDLLAHTLFKNSHLDIQEGRPAVVFINGEYWGLHNIREYHNENYLASKYKLNKDSIVILERSGEAFYGKDDGSGTYRELINFIKDNDLSKEENYKAVLQKMDVDNFIDYVIANCYLSNTDWPFNNVKYWRYKGSTSDSVAVAGKWRWMLSDLDYGTGYTGLEAAYRLDMLQRLLKSKTETGFIFNALSANSGFRQHFKNRFEYLMRNNLSTKNVISKIDSLQRLLEPEMPEHINRWQAPFSVNLWNYYVNELREFAKQRPEYQKKHLDAFAGDKAPQAAF